ncbi:YbjN domain-containing protein [Paracrocinitomix mangrovi]|uniref:YbjN domain-containing protein n=1 Tax=Paracrocinitomix mangrovi TaxID=2862509 RepID=UPI001C8D667A|nr:YbjN domain-containing protein [Paracrocinitomix mangrovi]UKN00784.1 YbjN domain-containing protein [Paracrocinitomix mangrovi]
MSNIQNYYDMIESCLRTLGVDPSTCRGNQAGSWALFKGSAKVYIDCWHIENQGRAYFQVMAPIMKIPEQNRETFYYDLLSFNDKLFSCAFALYNDWAWIKMIREVDGLDESEALAIIQRVGSYADDYDDILKQHYESAAAVGTENAQGAGGR